VHIGIVGPVDQVAGARRWLDRCAGEIPTFGEPSLLKKPFPGFEEAFHKGLVTPETSSISFSDEAGAISHERSTATPIKPFSEWLTCIPTRTRASLLATLIGLISY